MARMQSGAEFSQFDQMTSKEGKERIMNLESRVGAVISTYLPREEFDEYKKVAEENSIAVTNKLDSIEFGMSKMNGECMYWYRLWQMFFCSKFFRFMNFFGRWFIYAEDGKIYPNTPEWKYKRPMNLMQRILFRLRIRKILTKIQEGSEEGCEHPKPDGDVDGASEATVSDSTNL